jgi:SAM-dependent methyltransferase
MDEAVVQRLLALNHQFYQTFAVQFGATRLRLQPGVRRLLDSGCFGKSILDVGCGNGELARELVRRGFTGQYTGIDFSPGLLEVARQGLPGDFSAEFFLQNLAAPEWQSIPDGEVFDTVLAFAVLHHLPSQALRQQVLANVRRCMALGAKFILSNWQFLNSPRLVKRIQPWQAVGLQDTDVDPGDYLLDWRSGGTGLRYIHVFTEYELATLRAMGGFAAQDSFFSDGETGDLSHYQIWDSLGRLKSAPVIYL